MQVLLTMHSYCKVFIFFICMIVPASIVAQQNAGNQFLWKIAADLPSNRNNEPALGLAGAISGIHQQHLIIAGGANFPKLMPWEGGKKQYYPEVYVYSIKNNQAIRIQKSIVLSSPLAYAATCSTPLGIVIAGGENESGIQSAAAIIQWDTKRENIGITQLPALPIPLTNAAVASIDNVVYIAGGESSSGVSDQLFCLNLLDLTAGWKSIATLPHPVSHAVFVAATVD
ncbi:MAG: sodium transporter, partial [Sediminibacterium sp.]|nr:sodium transporter [Sediminibacterium sp.]